MPGSFNEDQPLYTQIANLLREQIRLYMIKPGTKLSQRKLASFYNVSKKTISDAFEILAAEGALITKPKSGTIVTDSIWMSINSDRQPTFSYVDKGQHKHSTDEMYSFYSILTREPVHLTGPKIAWELKYHEPIQKALVHVAARLDNPVNELFHVDITGLPALKESVAGIMQKRGVDVHPGEIMITGGMIESLTIIFLSFLSGGMRLVNETPSILNSMTMVQSLGAELVRIPMDDEGVSMPALIDAVRHKASNSVVCINPLNQYPSGINTSPERRNEIIAACKEFGVPLIENDAMRDFWLEKPHPKPLKAFYNDIIYVGSTLGAQLGMKISWIAAPPYVIKRLSDVKTQVDIVTNTLVQMVFDEMFRTGLYEEYLERSRPLYGKRMELTESLMDRYLPMAKWNRNKSFYLWMELKGIDTLKLFNHMKGFVILPGYFFDYADRSHFHLNPFADSVENLELCLRSIAENL